MMLKTLFIGFLLAALVPDEGVLRAVLFLTGAADAEQLDETTLERFEAIAARPIRLNGASRRALAEILTPYQIAALDDYRHRYGDVLSVTELAQVDGFGKEMAEALSPFVSFASSRAAGLPADSLRLAHSAVLRGGLSAGRTAWGGKYRLSADDRCELAFAARKSFTESPAGTAYLHTQWHEWDFVLGDFNARFGQGIALWSGFYLSQAGDLSAFCRRPGGIVPTWSYAGAGSHRGLAASWQRGRLQLSGFASAPGLKERWEKRKGRVTADFAANAQLYGLKGQGSLTCYHCVEGPSRLSIDFRHMLGPADLFGEAGLNLRNGTPAAVAGTLCPLGESFRLGGRVSALPSAFTGRKNGEYALLLGMEYLDGQYVALKGKEGFGSSVRKNALFFSVEGSLLPVPGVERRRQFRGLLRWQRQLSPALGLDFRLSQRNRNYDMPNRTDIRLDAAWSDALWTAKGRLNAVLGRGFASLAYLEAGRTGQQAFFWLRGTLFRIDDWDDRIYCYERDAPGAFSIPAYYGRGLALSLYGGWKIRWLGGKWKLYARASALAYPLMKGKKPGKAELKLQVAADF